MAQISLFDAVSAALGEEITPDLPRADLVGHAERAGLVPRPGGVESATAYLELVDPVERRARFAVQGVLVAACDVEAMPLDEDFLRAVEYGMPPSGGLGMGIDRLLMALTGSGIRETILFSLVRPE